MSERAAGASLVAAAVLFWVAWLLMPGVGVTDAARIFELVGESRPRVAASVLLQLLSAALYVPALLGVATHPSLGAARGVRAGAGLLLAGAMGSAADAVLHLLAYAMTAPGVDRSASIPVMQFMQGPGLALLLPFIAAFFAGGAWLSVALARASAVPRTNPWLHAIALGAAVAGGALASAGIGSPRGAGLAFLGIVAAAQAWLGIALRRIALAAALVLAASSAAQADARVVGWGADDFGQASIALGPRGRRPDSVRPTRIRVDAGLRQGR